MRYRFLGQPDERFPNLEPYRIYELIVTTSIWGRPRIIKPFYCPYESWKSFYHNWRPITMDIVRLENEALDKRKKAIYD